MSLLHLDQADRETAFEQLHAAMNRWSLSAEDVNMLPTKQRVWARLSQQSFVLTCKLRNCLKIGV